MQVALTHKSVPVPALAHVHADSSCACSLSGSKGTLGSDGCCDVICMSMHRTCMFLSRPWTKINRTHNDVHGATLCWQPLSWRLQSEHEKMICKYWTTYSAELDYSSLWKAFRRRMMEEEQTPTVLQDVFSDACKQWHCLSCRTWGWTRSPPWRWKTTTDRLVHGN